MLPKRFIYREGRRLPKDSIAVSSEIIHSLLVVEFESKGCSTDIIWISPNVFPGILYAINPNHTGPDNYDKIQLDF